MNNVEEQDGFQMSFLDHLDELRKRLVHSVIVIGICFAICFAFANRIYDFLAKPVKVQMQKQDRAKQASISGNVDLSKLKDDIIIQYTFAQDTSIAGVKIPLGTTIQTKKVIKDNKPELVLATQWSVGKNVIEAGTPISNIITKGDSQVIDDENSKLVLRTVTAPFMIYMMVALYAGIALAIPFLFYELWSFISPGLYSHEKKYIFPVLTMATVFFIIGAGFAYKIVFPATCNYLLGWATEGGFRTLLDAEDYLNLIIMIMLGLGIVFQIPTVAFVLGRIGLVNHRMMLKAWRYAIVIIAILSAVLTPTPDAGTMLMFAAPMVGLYFLSVGIVWLFGKPRSDEAIGSQSAIVKE